MRPPSTRVRSYGEMLGGVSAVIEYAVGALKVENIVICGHCDCGAMKRLLHTHNETHAVMRTVRPWLRHAEAARTVVEATRGDLSGEAKVQVLVEQNVVTQLQQRRTHPSVAAARATDRIALHGWGYGLRDGDVRTDDAERRAFAPLSVQKAVRGH